MRAELAEGARVGRYLLLTRIAQGGMANVWLAQATGPEGFQKTVVIKTILPHLADEPEFVRMFVNEALLAAQLDHPNIVHIFDLGESDGQHYIAMEHIAGRTLRHVQRELRRTRRVPPPWLILHVASSVCDALHYAHGKLDDRGRALGLVHRDISPDNIMVAFTGETKVLDFGIAKATTVSGKTQVGVLKGKHEYMAPEQIEAAMEGAQPTASIDVYSLGVVMYELITGRRPFRGANDLALMRQILSHDPRPPARFCSWVSPELSALILKAMARDPSQRFGTALELRAAIDEHFALMKAQPTTRHVAEYVRSLFGDTGAESTAMGVPTPGGQSGVHESLTGDPWDADVPTAETSEDSLRIDLSMVLLSGEDSQDVAPDSTGVPSSRRSAFPPSSLALPPAGWSPADAGVSHGPGHPGFAVTDSSTAPRDDVDELPDWGPPSLRGNGLEPTAEVVRDASPRADDLPGRVAASVPGAAPDDAEPKPAGIPTTAGSRAAQAPDGARESTERSPAPGAAAGDASGPAHFWDRIARKAKEQRPAQEEGRTEGLPSGNDPEAPVAAARDGHRWDAVVERLRRQETEDRGTRVAAADRRRGLSAEVRATTLFEDGLTRMRAKDLDGALECWTKAVELEPGNRLYQSNLRVLRRQLAERDKAS